TTVAQGSQRRDCPRSGLPQSRRQHSSRAPLRNFARACPGVAVPPAFGGKAVGDVSVRTWTISTTGLDRTTHAGQRLALANWYLSRFGSRRRGGSGNRACGFVQSGRGPARWCAGRPLAVSAVSGFVPV